MEAPVWTWQPETPAPKGKSCQQNLIDVLETLRCKARVLARRLPSAVPNSAPMPT